MLEWIEIRLEMALLLSVEFFDIFVFVHNVGVCVCVVSRCEPCPGTQCKEYRTKHEFEHARVMCASRGVFYGLTQSGSGGGGGWPFGAGGNVGQMNYDDTIFTDYTYSVYSYTYNQQVGNVGETATKVIAVSNGGNPRINGASGGYFAETYTAGTGACPVLGVSATNGMNSQAYGDIGYIYAGDGGNGGANGDYAINGNSLITWLNTGLIYGNIV